MVISSLEEHEKYHNLHRNVFQWMKQLPNHHRWKKIKAKMFSMSFQSWEREILIPLPRQSKWIALKKIHLYWKNMSKLDIINCIDCKVHTFSLSRLLKNSHCWYSWDEISPTYSSTGRTEKEPKCNFVEIYEKSFLIRFGKTMIKNSILADPKGKKYL